MRLKPNDLPDMELGEARRVTFNLAGAIGVNTITDFEISSPRLAFGTPSISGASVSVTVTAAATGTHAIIATAELTSNETVKGFVRAKVVDSTLEAGRTYG
jgi:hypothetical protein